MNLMVNLGTNMLDNWGSHNMRSDFMNRGDSSSSWGSMVGSNWGSSSNWGYSRSKRSSMVGSTSNLGTISTSQTSVGSSIARVGSSIAMVGSSNTIVSSTIEQLSISLGSRGSSSNSHKGRESNKGVHVDQC